MEKKKLLLVAVSVGVVLFIIISIPLLIVSPRQNPGSPVSQSAALSFAQERFSAVEASKLPQAEATQTEVPQAVPQASDNAASVSSTQIDETVFSSLPEAPQVTTITVQAPHTVAVPSAPVTRTQQTAAAKPAPAKAVVPEKPAPAVKETAKPAAAVAAKPPAESSKVTYNNYWVQTGAFSTEVRAEGAKESLASKGIASVIDNRNIDGKTWYRVRVGPYVSETEASYWLALVKTIDGFGDSQIRLTPALR